MGFSRYRFEQICEEQYNRYYKKAIQDIENGEYPHCSWITVNTFGDYVDFPVSEAYSIVRIWNDKLKNAVAEYQQKHEMRIEAQEAAEEQLRLQKEAIEEQLRLHRESVEELNNTFVQIDPEERRKRLYNENHDKSIELLMGDPYNLLYEEAEKLINDDGEIAQKELQSFMNDKRKQEYLALKTAEKKLKLAEEATQKIRETAEEELHKLKSERKEQIERRRQEAHKRSCVLLMSSPYNIIREEAEKLINDDGEIDKDALKFFMNAQKNREHIAKKAAEWEAMKTQQPQTNQLTDVQAKGPRVCHACGACIVDSDKFCRACGAELQRQCPACKKLLPVANKFCSECGNKL